MSKRWSKEHLKKLVASRTETIKRLKLENKIAAKRKSRLFLNVRKTVIS